MLKLLILILIIGGAFWLGRISAGSKRDKKSANKSQQDAPVIDIELEDESKD